MSEQNSLYVHIHISKERLEQFFQSESVAAEVDEDWIAWWDSRKMYSPSPLTAVPKFYDSKTNGDIATGLLALPQLGCFEEENTQEGVWTFSVLFLSENYQEILPTLAWVKSLAAFMAPEEKGFALIYDYFWGDKTVMAHIVLENKRAFLKHTSSTTELEPEVLATANAALNKAYDKFSELYKDE